MKDADWKHVEETLAILYHPVELDCDGYRLRLELVRIGKMELGICFHVNGSFQGAWVREDCEERRRFFRPIVRPAYTGAFRKSLGKLRKATRKELGVDLEKTFTYYAMHWTSFKSLKRHLVKNNQNIELIKGEADAPTA